LGAHIVLAPVPGRLAQLVGFHQTIRAHLIASEDEGFVTPGGLYKPNVLLFDFGRAYYLENVPRMVAEVVDLAGRAALIFPSEGQWQRPELRRWLEPLQTGPVRRACADRWRIHSTRATSSQALLTPQPPATISVSRGPPISPSGSVISARPELVLVWVPVAIATAS